MSQTEVCHQFAQVAHYLCEQIECYSPDLLIGLAHSGWLPVELAQDLWTQTRKNSLPPLLRTNFGSEKVAIYNRCRYEHDDMGTFYSGDGPDECEHAMNWIRNALDWQSELSTQIQNLGLANGAPKRVLVVDDFVAGGSTSFLFLSLLAALFPNSASVLIDVDLDGWKNRLAELWLEQFYPDALAKIEEQVSKEDNSDTQNMVRFRMIHSIAQLASGTEDIRPESLHWQPISPMSRSVQELNRFYPDCDWYALIDWVTACQKESIRLAVQLPRSEFAIGKNWYPKIETLPSCDDGSIT